MFFDDPAFACYAMHKQSIEDFIDELSKVSNPNDPNIQNCIADDCCLVFSLLTDDEKEYIEREVSRRWNRLH
jgi:hypothetical protein